MIVSLSPWPAGEPHDAIGETGMPRVGNVMYDRDMAVGVGAVLIEFRFRRARDN